ncbi:MAG: 2-dehydropantoate 2-reductase [Betaproteobacteria bacterium]|nr:MAG: 2-dehydropantoate 2-reductase [Betaproteobacteria bacterium]
MNITIIGTGAIGGWIAAKLALASAGHVVNVVARGETLRAVSDHGLRLRSTVGEERQEFVARVNAVESTTALPPQDLIVVAVKQPALAAVLHHITPLLAPHTMILSAMNGVPSWFFARTDRPLAGTALLSVDPSGAIGKALPAAQTIGCVVHAACSVSESGVIEHKMGNRLIIGEALGGNSERLSTLSQMLIAAGFDAPVSNDIHHDIWFKLWGNMTTNPVSAITGATSDKILADPQVRAFCSRVMIEAKLIGAAIGIHIEGEPESRHALTEKLGAFKTSMLQDVNAGRAVELDALVTVVREIGQALRIETPSTDALLGLARLMAQTRGLYPS